MLASITVIDVFVASFGGEAVLLSATNQRPAVTRSAQSPVDLSVVAWADQPHGAIAQQDRL
jgi:microcompartment protein CcmK/EutM